MTTILFSVFVIALFLLLILVVFTEDTVETAKEETKLIINTYLIGKKATLFDNTVHQIIDVLLDSPRPLLLDDNRYYSFTQIKHIC